MKTSKELSKKFDVLSITECRQVIEEDYDEEPEDWPISNEIPRSKRSVKDVSTYLIDGEPVTTWAPPTTRPLLKSRAVELRFKVLSMKPIFKN